MMQSDFTIGMRVTKVNIERGGGLIPAHFDINVYMRLKKLFQCRINTGKILSIQIKMEKNCKAGSVSGSVFHQYGDYIFPSYPRSWLPKIL